MRRRKVVRIFTISMEETKQHMMTMSTRQLEKPTPAPHLKKRKKLTMLVRCVRLKTLPFRRTMVALETSRNKRIMALFKLPVA